MNLLAIETATEGCSIALSVGGELLERFEMAPRRHAELILPWIDAMLAEAGVGKRQLDLIAVGRGPGAFTGVRLAVAVTQGIALGLDLPVLPVSSLAALSMRIRRAPGQQVLAAIDARMGEVYVGAFLYGSDGLPTPVGAECLCAPDAPPTLPAGDWRGVGSGFDAADGALRAALSSRLTECDAVQFPHAADVARIALAAHARGEAIAADALEPAYLRNKVAQTLVERGKA